MFTMTDDGEGALWIAPGTMPNMTEIETALESGPFTLTSEGVLESCKPRRLDRQGSDRVGDSRCSCCSSPTAANVNPHPEPMTSVSDLRGLVRETQAARLSAASAGRFPHCSCGQVVSTGVVKDTSVERRPRTLRGVGLVHGSSSTLPLGVGRR